jgi:hypothetical protein
MPLTIACPKCDARLQAPDTVRGKRVKCRKCGETFVARPVDDDEDDRPSRPAAKAAAKPRPRPVGDDEDDDRPRRPARASRRDEDDSGGDEDRPRRRRRDEDDEPRPRGKKGKKKKKAAGPPVLLLVLIGVGALVLIGGGIGVYFAFIKEEKPADNAVAKAGGPPPVTQLGLGGPGAAGAWVEQHDADGRYRIKFPSAPRTQNVTQQTPAGPVTLKVYLAGGQTEAFVCTHQQLPADRAGVSDDQILDRAIEGAKLQAQGATAGPSHPITYQSQPGREVTMTFPGKKGMMIIRVLLAGDRVIALSALGETATADAPRVKQFFDSLKIE